MIVISLVNPPRSLHGDLSKWLIEINTNVYVGNVNARIREALWERITETIKTGQATMVYTTDNEQGMNVKVWGTTWQATDFDGFLLIKRPFPKENTSNSRSSRSYLGHSKYSNFHNHSNPHSLDPATVKEEEVNEDKEVFAVIDIETTGLDFRKDSIIEIGFLKATSQRILLKKNYLIKTDKQLSEEIVKLTGITNDLLEKDGVDLGEAIKQLAKHTDHLPAVFHNANFDLKFLTSASKEAGIKMPRWTVHDTMQMAKRRIPGLENYQLQTLCNKLKCTSKSTHRALDDCIATWEVYVKLKNFDLNC